MMIGEGESISERQENKQAVADRAVMAYRRRFGWEPAVVASAPGRINLIGEHTDYNGGFVLPCAINRRTAVALGRGESILYSLDRMEERPATMERDGSWADYLRGVAWSLGSGDERPLRFHGTVAGNVPIGAGLSSSAALEAATGLALDTLYHLELSRQELALRCQRAENEFVGVNSGIMDQYASLFGRAGSALFVDCRTLESERVPLELEPAGLVLLVCDTRVKRNLVATGYNERRETCERAARTLGVPQLRDATEADLQRLSGDELKRARHVITEQSRVEAAVKALRRNDFTTFGELMYSSHASLRDDFEVSTPELNTFVEMAQTAGALGARLTGAGFGGAAIALVRQGDTDVLIDNTALQFKDRDFAEPSFYVFQPSDGARLESSASSG